MRRRKASVRKNKFEAMQLSDEVFKFLSTEIDRIVIETHKGFPLAEKAHFISENSSLFLSRPEITFDVERYSLDFVYTDGIVKIRDLEGKDIEVYFHNSYFFEDGLLKSVKYSYAV